MGDLTANFSFAELTHSAMAENLGIDNTPSSETREHLLTLAENLEKLRSLLGVAIHVNSAYRSPALNKAVRGVSNSAHLTGYAADFVAPDFGPPLKIVERVAAAIHAGEISVDQCIQEGSWVHASFAPTMRNQVLTAHFRNGVASYVTGVVAS